jgi:hypothetical protein
VICDASVASDLRVEAVRVLKAFALQGHKENRSRAEKGLTDAQSRIGDDAVTKAISEALAEIKRTAPPSSPAASP